MRPDVARDKRYTVTPDGRAGLEPPGLEPRRRLASTRLSAIGYIIKKDLLSMISAIHPFEHATPKIEEDRSAPDLRYRCRRYQSVAASCPNRYRP